jgi:hypothetical protein
MKTKITLLLLAICLSFGTTIAQEPDFDAAWAASMTPGAEHDFLKKMEGKWATEVTSCMMGSEPQVSKGKSTKTMILGGRYLEENYTGNMMDMPFSGRNTFAYDNVLKKYRTVWIDNMGTGIMIGEGTREGNKITIWASYPNMISGPDQKYRLVYVADSDKKHTYEMYMVDEDGKEAKQMTIVYTKK